MPLPDDTDARLVDRLVARDERAFNALVRAYQGRVFSLALRMLGNRAEAEDLAQEVFVQVFKAIGTFRGESKLSTWIYRIAVNLAKNRGKYLRVRHAGAHDELETLIRAADQLLYTSKQSGRNRATGAEIPTVLAHTANG